MNTACRRGHARCSIASELATFSDAGREPDAWEADSLAWAIYAFGARMYALAGNEAADALTPRGVRTAADWSRNPCSRAARAVRACLQPSTGLDGEGYLSGYRARMTYRKGVNPRLLPTPAIPFRA
jgi:hypothetical protein